MDISPITPDPIASINIRTRADLISMHVLLAASDPIVQSVGLDGNVVGSLLLSALTALNLTEEEQATFQGYVDALRAFHTTP